MPDKPTDEQSTNQSSEDEKENESQSSEKSNASKMYDKEDEKKEDDSSKEDEDEESSDDDDEESEDGDDKDKKKIKKEDKDDDEEEDEDDDKKKKDDKKDDKKNPPGKYELEHPEDSVLSDKDLQKIAKYAKKQGFSQEQAQAQVERENEIITEAFDQGVESAKKDAEEELKRLADKEWLEAAEKDEEIGGKDGKEFNKNVELSKRVFKRFGSEKLRKLLKDTGYGNHPELVRFTTRIGKAMSEDQFVHGNSKSNQEKTMSERMYGN